MNTENNNQATGEDEAFAENEVATLVDLTVDDETSTEINGGIGHLLPAVQKVS